jgi:serine/threonine protein kinase
MGEVYEVEHDELGIRRALKVLAKRFAGRQDLATRLRVEARALARLRHPNLIEVSDLGTAADQRIFYTMELLRGCTLRVLLGRKGWLSPRLAVRLLAQALDGLHAAHRAQMVHRDIKPENVFVCRNGLVKLLDFGVAKAIDAWMPSQQITGVGVTIGTPRYMAPEQVEAKPVDARTDVYSAGLVLWETLVGRPAFNDNDAIAAALSRLTKGVPDFDPTSMARIPAALRSAIMRACAREPENRYDSAATLAADIRRAVDEPLSPSIALLAFDPSAPASGVGVDADPTDPTEPGSVPTAGEASQDTEPDTIPDSVHVELTERMNESVGVDPQQPTPAALHAPAPMLGPSGTHMLPAVAAQFCPTAAAPMPALAAGASMGGQRPQTPAAGALSPRHARCVSNAPAAIASGAPPRARLGAALRPAALGASAGAIAVAIALAAMLWAGQHAKVSNEQNIADQVPTAVLSASGQATTTAASPSLDPSDSATAAAPMPATPMTDAHETGAVTTVAHPGLTPTTVRTSKTSGQNAKTGSVGPAPNSTPPRTTVKERLPASGL